MAKKKPVITKSVGVDKKFTPDPIEDSLTNLENTELSNEEQAAVKSVAKKKGKASFGELLNAQNAKRKLRMQKIIENGKVED